MPTISMFYGIIIRMYYAPKEHPPPHFHVYYGEHKPGRSGNGFIVARHSTLYDLWVQRNEATGVGFPCVLCPWVQLNISGSKNDRVRPYI